VLCFRCNAVSQDPRLLGTLQYRILAAVSFLQPDRSHGLEIQRLLKERTGRAPTAEAVYVSLDRMERKGLLSSGQSEPAPVKGGRRRRVYRLTEDGARARHEMDATVAALQAETPSGQPGPA